MTYFKHIADGIRTTAKGMGLTLRHLWAARKRRRVGDVRRDDFFGDTEGRVTLQYPLETIPIPDNGRYRLHNEMDDCIVCDKCAKVCPVDCIEIEPIRATEEVGKASDGSSIRLYAARFDIDMAKCCYCGLCTTVCPTECLTMTKTFDYSELDIRDMVYEFGNLTPAEAEEKKRLLEVFQAEKEALKAAAKTEPNDKTAAPRSAGPGPAGPGPAGPGPAGPRPVFRPGQKPVLPTDEQPATPPDATKVSKPPFRPKMKPQDSAAKPAPQPGEADQVPAEQSKPKVPFRPKMKPKDAAAKPAPEPAGADQVPAPVEPKAKVPFRPTMKPARTEPTSEADGKVPDEEKPKPKVPFRPTMKPRPRNEDE